MRLFALFERLEVVVLLANGVARLRLPRRRFLIHAYLQVASLGRVGMAVRVHGSLEDSILFVVLTCIDLFGTRVQPFRVLVVRLRFDLLDVPIVVQSSGQVVALLGLCEQVGTIRSPVPALLRTDFNAR